MEIVGGTIILPFLRAYASNWLWQHYASDASNPYKLFHGCMSDQALHLLPTLWFRNTWSWNGDADKPTLKEIKSGNNCNIIEASHPTLGKRWLYCPTGSGKMMTLWEVASELSQRLTRIFLQNSSGQRPVYGGIQKFQNDPHWQNLILFHEYFHGDNGAGIGASHQTGWTGLVAQLIQQFGEYEIQHRESDIEQNKEVIALA